MQLIGELDLERDGLQGSLVDARARLRTTKGHLTTPGRWPRGLGCGVGAALVPDFTIEALPDEESQEHQRGATKRPTKFICRA